MYIFLFWWRTITGKKTWWLRDFYSDHNLSCFICIFIGPIKCVGAQLVIVFGLIQCYQQLRNYHTIRVPKWVFTRIETKKDFIWTRASESIYCYKKLFNFWIETGLFVLTMSIFTAYNFFWTRLSQLIKF